MSLLIKRVFDVVVALTVLVIFAPLMLIIAACIWIADGRPVIYRAKRVGVGGRLFWMSKFRTMRVRDDRGSAISSAEDSRVFPLGRLLRILKLDELPQFWDILCGEMSIVGPRPEDPDIVEMHYTSEFRKTLRVRPGLTSPGSLYYYEHAEASLAGENAEALYINAILPKKIAIDLAYIESGTFISDLWIIMRTVVVIARRAVQNR